MDLPHQRQRYREQISTDINEDDPLEAYDNFVQWTLKNYAENDPQSGLVQLLEEATQKFKDDPSYKTDLRYLKLWSLYARRVKNPASIYASLLSGGIGTTYSLLYEEYANVLEQSGQWVSSLSLLTSICNVEYSYFEAENVYRIGIGRNPRPLSRLKSRFKDFQSRHPSITSGTPSIEPSSTKPPTDIARNNNKGRDSPSGSRYALMLAPPAPGKRPEKLRFNLSLLFTEEGKEYSVQEARARSMGLLGKKWTLPPASELTRNIPTSSSSVKPNKTATSSRNLMVAEPTVTINTKAALADVFGMYNSPEKTMRSAQIPGSKHAPLKKVNLFPSAIPPPPPPPNVAQAKTPGKCVYL
jgi:checkpoint serine/threonine-protein kinase